MSLDQPFIFASFWEGQDPPRRRLKLHMSDAEGLSPHAGDELFSVQSQEYGRAGGGRRAPSATALRRGARSAQARAEPVILLPRGGPVGASGLPGSGGGVAMPGIPDSVVPDSASDHRDEKQRTPS